MCVQFLFQATPVYKTKICHIFRASFFSKSQYCKKSLAKNCEKIIKSHVKTYPKMDANGHPNIELAATAAMAICK